MTDLDPDAARDRLLAEHRGTVADVLACAAAVAAGFETTDGDGSATADGDPASQEVGEMKATRHSRGLRSTLNAVLERAGLKEALVELLPDLVAAAGGTLRAPPVAAPPYLAVTATGPVLRATLDGARLVVRIEAYTVDDGAFCWREPTPDEAVRVDLR